MNLIEQRTSSDCLICSLATILEIEYDDVPKEVAEQENQWNTMQKFLASRNLTCWSFSIWGDEEPLLKFGNEKLEYHFHPPGFWMASVKSPRNDDGHVVIMRSTKIYFDPHPQREMGHRGFEEAMILMPLADWSDRVRAT
jgi:hypothetical protein